MVPWPLSWQLTSSKIRWKLFGARPRSIPLVRVTLRLALPPCFFFLRLPDISTSVTVGFLAGAVGLWQRESYRAREKYEPFVTAIFMSCMCKKTHIYTHNIIKKHRYVYATHLPFPLFWSVPTLPNLVIQLLFLICNYSTKPRYFHFILTHAYIHRSNIPRSTNAHLCSH